MTSYLSQYRWPFFNLTKTVWYGFNTIRWILKNAYITLPVRYIYRSILTFNTGRTKRRVGKERKCGPGSLFSFLIPACRGAGLTPAGRFLVLFSSRKKVQEESDRWVTPEESSSALHTDTATHTSTNRRNHQICIFTSAFQENRPVSVLPEVVMVHNQNA